MDLVRHFEKQQIKDVERPFLKAGDVVRVEMTVKEGEKTRLQAFEGTLLSVSGSGPSTTFTVRRETGHFGVERIFPLYSPLIANIEVQRRQKVRRANLSYLRQAGRRRFKDDVRAMQRYVKEQEGKKRLEEVATAKADKDSEMKRKQEEKTQTEVDKDSPSPGSPSAEATEDPASAQGSGGQGKPDKEA